MDNKAQEIGGLRLAGLQEGESRVCWDPVPAICLRQASIFSKPLEVQLCRRGRAAPAEVSAAAARAMVPGGARCAEPGCDGHLVFDAEDLHEVCEACGRVVETGADLQSCAWGGKFVGEGDDGAAAGAAARSLAEHARARDGR